MQFHCRLRMTVLVAALGVLGLVTGCGGGSGGDGAAAPGPVPGAIALPETGQTTCSSEFGALIACAGILRKRGTPPKVLVDVTTDEWDDVIGINLKGVFLSNRAVLPTMIAQRSGMKGIQEWLSFYFKSPMTAPGLYPEHDLFIQLMKLKNTLRHLRGEELITHLGLEYYD